MVSSSNRALFASAPLTFAPHGYLRSLISRVLGLGCHTSSATAAPWTKMTSYLQSGYLCMYAFRKLQALGRLEHYLHTCSFYQLRFPNLFDAPCMSPTRLHSVQATSDLIQISTVHFDVWCCVHGRLHLPYTPIHNPSHTLRPGQVSIIYDGPLKELRIFTDYGRTSRPLYIVEGNRLLVNKTHIRRLISPLPDEEEYAWPQLVQDGLVE